MSGSNKGKELKHIRVWRLGDSLGNQVGDLGKESMRKWYLCDLREQTMNISWEEHIRQREQHVPFCSETQISSTWSRNSKKTINTGAK